MSSYFGNDIGIDLGTANVLVYVKNKGIILNEPSVVAVDNNTGKLIAVGREAKKMIGKSHQNISVIKPLRKGVISNYNITLKMLRQFITITCGKRRFFRPRIMVCVPSGVNNVERKAVKDAASEAGGAKVFIIDEPTAAAIGAGIDISAPDGHMIVDIGGGTTDIAVISLGGIVAEHSIKIAGETFNELIQRYVKRAYGILIGEKTAEEIKVSIGSVVEKNPDEYIDCRGRQLVTGLPEYIQISSNELIDVLMEPVLQIIDGIKFVFESTPPEIASDIFYHGITFTGGGALLNGIDTVISRALDVPCYIAENPSECVAIGTGIALDNMRE